MRTVFVAMAAASLGWVGAAPAGAVTFKTSGADGDIEPYSNLTACAWLDFGNRLFVGEFSATGYVQGPGTRAGTVRGVVPVVASGSWSDCIQGAYDGATSGAAKYTLSGVAGTSEVLVVLECVVVSGAMTCA